MEDAQAMSEHTPGPWEVCNGSDVFASVTADGQEAIDGDGFQICHCNESTPANTTRLIGDADEGYLSWDEITANARLIAAAPDLLAALEAVEWRKDHDYLTNRCPACRNVEKWGHAPDCQIAAALKAAKGE